MNIILFDADEVAKPLPRADARSQHIRKILHKTAGDTFEAGIINGMHGTATITDVQNGDICFTFEPSGESAPLFPLVLIVGFPRPIQLKRLLRDVSSLGVGEVHLTGTELGEKSYLRSSLLERGAATSALVDGAMQAKTTRIPRLFMHESLKECIDCVQSDNAECVKLLFDNVKPKHKLSDMAVARGFAGKTVVAAIGSERGWTDAERDTLTNAGFAACSLGSRILRTETATVTAVSLILAGMGAI